MKKRRDPLRPNAADERSATNPFDALKGRFPEGEPLVSAAETPVDDDGPPDAQSRVVVRRENKGRGGKTVTRINGIALAAPALDALAREIKRALGCGAVVDGDDVVVQGAQAERAANWLRANGHRDVIIGN